mmetsp:Transcript_18666/g.51906  ORF Transcript_18666/g.51906 Transcript_18666/m.51906 type:complete len:252 (+) Transcript_18666:1881-2636(+)
MDLCQHRRKTRCCAHVRIVAPMRSTSLMTRSWTASDMAKHDHNVTNLRQPCCTKINQRRTRIKWKRATSTTTSMNTIPPSPSAKTSKNVVSPSKADCTKPLPKKITRHVVHVGKSSTDCVLKEVVDVHFHNFSRLAHAPIQSLFSGTFDFHGLKWYLRLYPRGEDKSMGDDKEGYIAIYLCPDWVSWKSNDRCSVKHTIEIKKLDIKRVSGWRSYTKGRGGRGWKEFVMRKDVLERGRDDNTLTFTVTLEA